MLKKNAIRRNSTVVNRKDLRINEPPENSLKRNELRERK